MKKLLEAILQNLLNALLEKVELLSDIDTTEMDDNNFLINTKSVNSNIISSYVEERNSMKNILMVLLNNDTDAIINKIADPKNYKKYAGLILPENKALLKLLIEAGITLFGDDGNFNWIDTSKITDMSELFKGNYYFNGHIELWDVSNVTNMSSMFDNAHYFNQPIGDWDVSNVTNMKDMFFNAHSFDLPIGDWDVSNVTTMEGMFYHANNFNQPIGDWDVYNVTNMSYMFRGCYEFNQDISDWAVSNVTNMAKMFYVAVSFEQDISIWNVQNVITNDDIFHKCPINNIDEFKPKFNEK